LVLLLVVLLVLWATPTQGLSLAWDQLVLPHQRKVVSYGASVITVYGTPIVGRWRCATNWRVRIKNDAGFR